MIKNQFHALFVDIKYSFIDLFDDIHKFLNRYFDDQFLTIAGIAILAILAVTIFIKFSTGSDH